MDNLFNNILANVSADITIGSAIITMLVAVVFGTTLCFIRKSREFFNHINFSRHIRIQTRAIQIVKPF